VKLVEAHRYPYEKLQTHSCALSALERALQTSAGRVVSEHAVAGTLNPSVTLTWQEGHRFPCWGQCCWPHNIFDRAPPWPRFFLLG
jgi:hypothetical protein